MPWCTHGVGGKFNKFITVMEMEYYIIYIFNHDPFFVLDYGFLFGEDIMEDILNWQYMPLVPPLLTLILVLATRRVVLSLGVGIIASAFVIASGDLLETLRLIWEQTALIFVDGGAINTWNAYILIFLVLLGLMTAFISMSGGASEFSNWAIGKVKSKRQAKLLAGVLGIIIFIDDYFSALMTGSSFKTYHR